MEQGAYRYILEMQTPLGTRRGELRLSVCGSSLTGELTMFTRTTPILEGKCNGQHISFCGEMKNLLKDIPYQSEGKISGSKLSLVFATESCHYPATGFLASNISEKEE